MERWTLVNEIKERMKRIENLPNGYEKERLSGAGADYLRLYPKYMAQLKDFYRWDEIFINQDYQFFMALNQMKNYAVLIVTLASAAGAGMSICRQWYLLISEICSFKKKGEKLPCNLSEYIVYLALAGDFSKEKFNDWPSVSASQTTADLVLYSLMTGKPLKFDSCKSYFYDDTIWIRYYDMLIAGDCLGVKTACKDFANYFWNDCEVNEISIYSPEEYPCFEPEYNAALAIALKREGMDISFEDEVYERFYIGALSII